ncbi:branched-chain amino acid ABC transporter permease [Neorhizobium sp. P12A]|uniref:branched-chain amino acid ABC transporter permease n=1 Tax=Neorhizobium sp. P12A TaxID=2268027 RepID=UPI0032B2912C
MVRPQGLFGLSVIKRHEFRAARLPGGDGEIAFHLPLAGRMAFVGVAIVALVLLPVAIYPIHLVKIACLAIFAASFNFLIGFVGIVSFGQAALFGTGAYVTAHAMKVWMLSPEVALLLGVASALVLGLAMGALAIRRSGIYQAMITLAIAQMVYFVYAQAPFTHGDDGIQSVPRGILFGLVDLSDDRAVYGLAVIALVVVFWGMRWLLSSRLGMILVAIRDDERRALSLGYNVYRYKLGAFAIAAAGAGLAGSISAIAFQLATLSGAHWQLSGEAVLMALVGGIGTLSGPIVGAAIVAMMQQILAPFGAWVLVIQGIVFVLCVLLFRDGLISHLAGIPGLLGAYRGKADRTKA